MISIMVSLEKKFGRFRLTHSNVVPNLAFLTFSSFITSRIQLQEVREIGQVYSEEDGEAEEEEKHKEEQLQNGMISSIMMMTCRSTACEEINNAAFTRKIGAVKAREKICQMAVTDWNDVYANPSRNMQRTWVKDVKRNVEKQKNYGTEKRILVFNKILWSIFGRI
ncbi:hypothetical protein Tco_0355396 [Tanacetum coccineum]